MGIYLNPGNIQFRTTLNADIYVDKTDLIQYLNTVINSPRKYLAVSRPRRFGKSTTLNMISAYYDRSADSRSLFEGRKLSECKDWDRYLGRFDVLRITMTDFIKFNVPLDKSLSKIEYRILEDLIEAYPDTKYDPDDFLYSMDRFSRQSGRQFIILIDEWDSIFRERKNDKEGQRIYLNFLRDWLKDKDYVALAYLTGILPIKKYGHQSALNMFDEYSMIAPLQLASYTGFTEEEVKILCEHYGRDFAAIKEWYDGYMVSDIIPPDPRIVKENAVPKAHQYSLYSPLSVVDAVITGHIMNYWNNTESYEALAEYIRMDYDGLKDTIALLMDGGRVRADISMYQNDMITFHGKDDILALLIHLGYLGYDSDTGEVFIPNREIMDVFRTSTKSKEWVGTFQSYKISEELLQATWACDEGKVAELLEEAHDKASNKTYNNEAALSYAIQYAYYAAQKYYTTILELDSGKGYADIVYLPSPKYPDKPAMVIELKYNKDVETALSQIKRRNYPARLEHYKGNVLLVSISYDRSLKSAAPEYKRHRCVIERA